jgi:hypothetical protein
MSSNLHNSKATDQEQRPDPGLSSDELRAEQAGVLPERDAMSIISVGGLEGGLPSPDVLGDILDTDVPVETLPVDGLPVEHYPIDRLPIDRLPVDPLPPIDTLPVEPPIDTLPVDPPILVDQPVDSLPVEPPVDGDPIGIPDLPATSTDASVKA